MERICIIQLYSPSKILVMEMDNLENSVTYEPRDTVSLMVISGNLCVMNSSGIITKLENSEKILECSPLLHPITASFHLENRIFIVSTHSISSFLPDSPLDYESYETEKRITKGEIRRFGDTRLMIFDRRSQTCFIWETDKPKRKYRDQLFTTYLNHCTKLLVTHPQKFVILTASEVHFVVFGTDSDNN
uniref:CNH domain-containing protein n=1 Tax=Caenorhabditis tropicalis TaxID=1561998 RepID=A0A1I7T3R5_9PELO